MTIGKHPEHININWYGPYSLEYAIKTFTNEGYDCGLYQIYGHHPIYGSNVLLYVGKTEAQTFSKRLEQHKWVEKNADPNNIQVYIGRLAAGNYGSYLVWLDHINIAEKLIILSCTPARNGQNVSTFSRDVGHVHVFNWGNHRDILPEISGRRWTTTFEEDDFDGTWY